MTKQSQNVLIRPVRVEDARRIQAIYTPYILNTVFNLEETVGTIEYYEQVINEVSAQLPFLVAEYHNTVIGFVYVSEVSFMLNLTNTRALSIYVADDAPIRGVGQMLLDALEDALAEQGICQIIANIVAANDRSIRFHQKNGFQLLSTFPQAGYKFGQWHDVTWYGKKLDTIASYSDTQAVNLAYS